MYVLQSVVHTQVLVLAGTWPQFVACQRSMHNPFIFQAVQDRDVVI